MASELVGKLKAANNRPLALDVQKDSSNNAILTQRPRTGWSDSSGSAAVEQSSYEDTLEDAIRSRLSQKEEQVTIEAAIREKLRQPGTADISHRNRRRIGVVPVPLEEDTMGLGV
jgi:hypothetical protein